MLEGSLIFHTLWLQDDNGQLEPTKCEMFVNPPTSEEVAHASLLVYIATSRNCIPAIQTVLE